jgi:hypothetical protein
MFILPRAIQEAKMEKGEKGTRNTGESGSSHRAGFISSMLLVASLMHSRGSILCLIGQ